MTMAEWVVWNHDVRVFFDTDWVSGLENANFDVIRLQQICIIAINHRSLWWLRFVKSITKLFIHSNRVYLTVQRYLNDPWHVRRGQYMTLRKPDRANACQVRKAHRVSSDVQSEGSPCILWCSVRRLRLMSSRKTWIFGKFKCFNGKISLTPPPPWGPSRQML